ncbi:GvpL/GvpF family gas vesicle protein [Streptomyces endophytica]|uniref:GvpL/GvpF family gas vesicle protein n=1 Tax=Streptomyces endophytica TaxID=2991496 RepID=A0ABY6PFD6_9ACTN|nr:GvpL/GvpF family gas vesicle protein [Streptomyces endophytica]UZJ32471.1 GvpL/GvpF family gas vesicle protein [Streptomyces endophytica]
MPVYVYSIVSRSHPQKLDGLHGVGDPPSELRTVVGEKLTAVVSDAPEELRPKRRDLAAHQAVQERLMADGTALPLQFGFTADDEDAVRTVLEERAEEFAERLQALEGCVEYHLKVAQDEEAMLRQILTESDQARRMNEEVRSGRAGPDLPLALGELVSKEVDARKDRLAAAVSEALGGFAREESTYKPAGDDFLSMSFLVDKEQEERLRSAVQKIADELGEDFDLRLRGPLPVYSFV